MSLVGSILAGGVDAHLLEGEELKSLGGEHLVDANRLVVLETIADFTVERECFLGVGFVEFGHSALLSATYILHKQGHLSSLFILLCLPILFFISLTRGRLSTRLSLHDQVMSTHTIHNGTRFITVSLHNLPPVVHKMGESDKNEFVKLHLDRQKAVKALKVSMALHSLETIRKREEVLDAIEVKMKSISSKYL